MLPLGTLLVLIWAPEQFEFQTPSFRLSRVHSLSTCKSADSFCDQALIARFFYGSRKSENTLIKTEIG